MKEHGADSGDKLGLCSQIRKETVKKGDRAITGYPDQTYAFWNTHWLQGYQCNDLTPGKLWLYLCVYLTPDPNLKREKFQGITLTNLNMQAKHLVIQCTRANIFIHEEKKKKITLIEVVYIGV